MGSVPRGPSPVPPAKPPSGPSLPGLGPFFLTTAMLAQSTTGQLPGTTPCGRDQLICPSGKISGFPDFLSSPSDKNILIFRNCDSVYIPCRPVPPRGGSRSSRNAGRDAMDAIGAFDEWRWRGRRSRVVLDTQCRCRRWLSGLVRRGEHEGSRNTIARGMPGDFRCDRGDYARMLCFPKLHARLRAHQAPGIPCAL